MSATVVSAPLHRRVRQLAEAKARLAASFVVLEMDWLPVSAPLLCRRLGYCDEAVRDVLVMGAAEDGDCGVEATMAGIPATERDEALGTLTKHNLLDLQLYSFARELVKRARLERKHVYTRAHANVNAINGRALIQVLGVRGREKGRERREIAARSRRSAPSLSPNRKHARKECF